MTTRFTTKVDEYLTTIAIKTVKEEDWLQTWETLVKTLFTKEGNSRLGIALGLPSTIPPYSYRSGDLEALIEEYEEKMSSLGDDASLAQVDMQSWMQKTQLTLLSMSSISKQLHDSAQGIIRKIGG